LFTAEPKKEAASPNLWTAKEEVEKVVGTFYFDTLFSIQLCDIFFQYIFYTFFLKKYFLKHLFFSNTHNDNAY
jgi:hypothetical protein